MQHDHVTIGTNKTCPFTTHSEAAVTSNDINHIIFSTLTKGERNTAHSTVVHIE